MPSSEGTADFIFLADLVAHPRRGGCTTAMTSFLRLRSGLLATAICIWRRKKREVWSRFAPSCITGARVTRSAWRSRQTPIRRHRAARSVFELDSWQVFPVNGPVNLLRLFNVYEQVDRPEPEVRPFTPRELRLTRSRRIFSKNSAARHLAAPSVTTRTMRSFLHRICRRG